MRKLKALLTFYRKLIIPSLVLSALSGSMGIAITGEFSQTPTGISYIFIAPLMHYFIYELKYNNEYYFYYNMGISKLTLWLNTLVLSTTIGIILITL